MIKKLIMLYQDIKILKSSSLFDEKKYREMYLNKKYINPYLHYLLIGWKKGNNPSFKFDGNKYLEMYEDVKNALGCPLVHYERYKNSENREYFSVYEDYTNTHYESLKEERTKLRKNAHKKNKNLILKKKNTRILVYCHIYYPLSFQEIKEYLLNLSDYNYDLIISFTKDKYYSSLRSEIENFKADTKFYEYEDKGADIGPFIKTMNEVNLNNYDIVFKLYSISTEKGIRLEYSKIFEDRDLFLYAYEGILGASNVHNTIDLIMNDNAGLVCADKLLVDEPNYKINLINDRLKKMNFNIDKNFRYIIGNCFAINAKILKRFKKVNLKLEDYQKPDHSFFSIANAMEEYISYIPKKYKYKTNFVSINDDKWSNVEKQLEKYSYLNVINNFDYDYSEDFIYFTLRPKFIKKAYVEEICISEIKRMWDDKIYSLNETSPFDYLNNNKQRYQDYCDYHKRVFQSNRTLAKFDKLIKSIEKNGYNERNVIIINALNNCIVDGQHRSCILLKKFGKDFRLNVLKLEFINIDINLLKPDSDLSNL